MKKMISFILAVAVSAAVAMPAFAADTTDNGDGTWTTSGSDASYAGKMMTMVAYEGGEITVDSIQYIDQTTADENGAFAFENYIPKNLPKTDYTVLVGGETLDKALPAGTIKAPEIVDVAVTGKASAIGDTAIKVDFCAPGTTEALVTADVVDGAYTANVAPGTYDVVVKAAGYLSHTTTGVPVDAALDLGSVTLAAGDVNGSGAVTIEDIGFVIGAFSDASLYDITKDFNASGTITIEDVGFATANFKAEAKVVAYGK